MIVSADRTFGSVAAAGAAAIASGDGVGASINLVFSTVATEATITGGTTILARGTRSPTTQRADRSPTGTRRASRARPAPAGDEP